MVSYFKRLVPELIKDFIRYKILDGFAVKSYSQEGEDMILRRIFGDKETGFYVDIGAHHPKRFSNTYYFYKRGWSGINIDAMPRSMRLFNRIRSRDINLEIPVSANEDILTYYVFNEPALSGFDEHLAEQRDASGNTYEIEKKIDLQTRSLASILDEFLPRDQKIDFMTIDVEGLDLDVLKSNDWDKYRPTIVLVEVLGSSLSDLGSSTVSRMLNVQGYRIFAKALHTVIFELIPTE